MRHFIGTILVLVAALTATDTSAASERYAGSFALPGASPRASATLFVRRTGPLDAALDLVERSDAGPIRNYDLEMTQRLHLIVISDDFATFEHVHPALGPSGDFTIAFHAPRAGRYYLYADGEPHGFGRTVFRFAISFGRAPHRSPFLAATPATANAGPYTVMLDSLALHATRATTIGVRIARNGHPARDLEPYLGGAAHAVFVDAGTLAYVHVHPDSGTGNVAMSGMPGMSGMSGMSAMETPAPLSNRTRVAPAMQLHVGAVAAGRYKLWLQFRGGGHLYVAPFILNAN